jgi:hypothetical protein
MIIVFYILFAVGVLYGVIKIGLIALGNHSDKKTFGLPTKDIRVLSDPARKIMEELNTVPATNRPQGDMPRALAALDKKFGGREKVNEHFSQKYWVSSDYGRKEAYRFLWNDHDSCKYDRHCDMQEYRDIMVGLQGINKALGEQAYALEMAGISGQLEQAQNMIEQMKEEKKIITTITKELAR